jgi:uncharacterized membrane protein YccC
MATEEEEAAAVWLGLRISFTATACLVLSEWWQLGQRSLSVYSAHLAMVLFPYSAFQKTVERVVGRLLGVGYGLLLVWWVRDLTLVFLLLTVLGQLVFFYVMASNRLAYAALMGGLFIGVMVAKGITAPLSAGPYAASLAGQLLLAGAMIILVNWWSGAERTLTIETRGEPLWPLRRDWLSKARMVSSGQLGSMFVAIWFDLPVLPTLISATILGISTPDPQAMFKKGYHRALGVFLGGGYALVCMLLLAQLPNFSLLAVLVFLGMFIAAYYTKMSTGYSYAFMQMGLVLPMVLIGTSGEIGSIGTAVQRLIGVGAGLAVAEVVLICWPKGAPASAAAPPQVPAPATAGASAQVVHPGG